MAFRILQSAIQMAIPTNWIRGRKHDASSPRDDQVQFQTPAKAALLLKLNRPSACTLHNFPPEIREMVYDYCLWFEPTRATPPLLVALRGDWALYEEALQCFHAHNWFRLSKHNFEAFVNAFSVDRVGLIKRLYLKLDPINPCLIDQECHLRTQWEFQTFLCDFLGGKESKLALATNIEHLAIQFIVSKEHGEAARWVVEKYLEAPRRLKTLQLRMINEGTPTFNPSPGNQAALLQDFNELLGIRGKCVARTRGDPRMMGR